MAKKSAAGGIFRRRRFRLVDKSLAAKSVSALFFSLDRHTLGQIAGLIHIETFRDRDIIPQQLQRHHRE